MTRGLEELEGPRDLGDYLVRVENDRYIVMRGKYKGAYLDSIPRGYIRKFVLKKWVDSMTEEELELFQLYGRKDDMVTELHMDEHFTKTISDAFAKAQELGHTEITLRFAVPKGEKTIIDQLKMRGTPIELIGSYILAGEEELAHAAFHSCILECVYELLAQEHKMPVHFLGKTDVSKLNIGITTYQGHEHTRSAADDFNASIVGLIHDISADLVNHIVSAVKPKTAIHLLPVQTETLLSINQPETAIVSLGGSCKLMYAAKS